MSTAKLLCCWEFYRTHIKRPYIIKQNVVLPRNLFFYSAFFQLSTLIYELLYSYLRIEQPILLYKSLWLLCIIIAFFLQQYLEIECKVFFEKLSWHLISIFLFVTKKVLKVLFLSFFFRLLVATIWYLLATHMNEIIFVVFTMGKWSSCKNNSPCMFVIGPFYDKNRMKGLSPVKVLHINVMHVLEIPEIYSYEKCKAWLTTNDYSILCCDCRRMLTNDFLA